MLSSDATFSMEMFPFEHCPEGNGDVSSVCFIRENNNNNNNNNKRRKKTKEDRDENKLDNVKQSHDEVYGCLKGGSGNSGGRRLAIYIVEEAWLNEKEEE
ncbi:hypothetical protein Tco_0818162 [Tanacetum coccineum]